MSFKYRVSTSTRDTGAITGFCCEEMEGAYRRRDAFIDQYTRTATLNFRPRLLCINYCPFCGEEVEFERY